MFPVLESDLGYYMLLVVTHRVCKTRSNTGPQKRRMTRLSRSKIPPVCVLRLFGGREMYSVDIYSRVRRACLKDGMSSREAARYFNKDRKTIAKMLRHGLA